MAGAIKHMQRSHRSHTKSNQYGIYNQFHRNAYARAEYKASKMTVFQQIGSVLRKALPSSKTAS